MQLQSLWKISGKAVGSSTRWKQPVKTWNSVGRQRKETQSIENCANKGSIELNRTLEQDDPCTSKQAYVSDCWRPSVSGRSVRLIAWEDLNMSALRYVLLQVISDATHAGPGFSGGDSSPPNSPNLNTLLYTKYKNPIFAYRICMREI